MAKLSESAGNKESDIVAAVAVAIDLSLPFILPTPIVSGGYTNVNDSRFPV